MNETIKSANGMSKLVRARFGPGMLLEHEDLERLNTYTRELSRLMFRSFFGCGVVCGLVVKLGNDGVERSGKLFISVGAGLALDCNGDPVYLPKDHPPSPVDVEGENVPDGLWVLLCGTKKLCAPRTAMCASDDDEPTSACTQERDDYEIRVVSDPSKYNCKCSLKKSNRTPVISTVAAASDNTCRCADPTLDCYVDHYAGKCNCDECSNCDCKCILLARLHKTGDSVQWSVDYGVRRFIRPVLMRDPCPTTVTETTTNPSSITMGNGHRLAPQTTEGATTGGAATGGAATEEKDELQKMKDVIADLGRKLESATGDLKEMRQKLEKTIGKKEMAVPQSLPMASANSKSGPQPASAAKITRKKAKRKTVKKTVR